MSTKTNDSNTAHDGAGDHDDLVSHLTPYRRAQMSPSAAMNSSQAQQEPGDDDLMESGPGVSGTRKVDGPGDDGDKKSRPVNRRFSKIHQPDLPRLREHIEGVEDDPNDDLKNFADREDDVDEDVWDDPSEGSEGDSSDDSDEPDGINQTAARKSVWTDVLANITGGRYRDAMSLTVMNHAPTGKSSTASEVSSNTLDWRTNEPEFVQGRKYTVLTTEQAADWIEKQKSGDKSIVKALRAACRYKGPEVNKQIRRLMNLCERHGLKMSSSAAVLIHSVSKKDDDCEAFEQRVDRTIEYFMRSGKQDWLKFLEETAGGTTKKIKDSPLESEPGTLMLQQDHPDCERAWATLLAGVSNTLSYTAESGNSWVKHYANWLSDKRVITIGLVTINGKFPEQKRGEDIDDLTDRSTKMLEILRTQLRLANMSSQTPDDSAQTGNLVSAVRQEYADDMMEHLRDAMTRKRGLQTMTLKKVTALLKDSEVRKRTTIFGEHGGEQNRTKSRREDKRPNGKGNKKNTDSEARRRK